MKVLELEEPLKSTTPLLQANLIIVMVNQHSFFPRVRSKCFDYAGNKTGNIIMFISPIFMIVL